MNDKIFYPIPKVDTLDEGMLVITLEKTIK